MGNEVKVGAFLNFLDGGTNTLVGTNAALDRFQILSSTSRLAIGNSVTTSANNTIAIGNAAVASALDALAIGTSVNASSSYAISIGNSSTASGAFGIALGQNSHSKATDTIAIGQGAGLTTGTTGARAILIGQYSGGAALNQIVGQDAICIGTQTRSTATNSIAIGATAQSNNSNAIAIGPNTIVNGSSSVAIGDGAALNTIGSIAIGGAGVTSNSDFTVCIGYNSVINNGLSSIAIGRQAQVDANNSLIFNTSNTSQVNGVANTAVFVISGSTGVTPQFGIRMAGPEFPTYTVATLPTVTNSRAGLAGVIIVTDEIGGPTLAISDGSNWRRVKDGNIVT